MTVVHAPEPVPAEAPPTGVQLWPCTDPARCTVHHVETPDPGHVVWVYASGRRQTWRAGDMVQIERVDP